MLGVAAVTEEEEDEEDEPPEWVDPDGEPTERLPARERPSWQEVTLEEALERAAPPAAGSPQAQ